MHRIDHATLSADENGPGKDGFTEGDPGITAATIVTADFMNAVQEEIAGAVEGQDGVLSKLNSGQLSAALEALRARHDGTRFLSPMSAVIDAGWTRLGLFADPTITSSAINARAAFELTPLLPRNASITYVRVLVEPGAARAGGDRTFSQLHRQAFPSYPAAGSHALVQQGANVYHDGDTATRWITHDHSAAPLLVSDGNAWLLNVVAGHDADTNLDKVYGVAVEFTTPKLLA